MSKKLLIIIGICILSISLVACSNTNEIEINENDESLKVSKEENLFDKDIIIADDDIVKITVSRKEKTHLGNSIGYSFSILNKSDKTIEFYVKDVTVDGNKSETDFDEGFKMTLETITMFSTQMSFRNIESMYDLKNTEGIFCIETNNEVKEYKFKIE